MRLALSLSLAGLLSQAAAFPSTELAKAVEEKMAWTKKPARRVAENGQGRRLATYSQRYIVSAVDYITWQMSNCILQNAKLRIHCLGNGELTVLDTNFLDLITLKDVEEETCLRVSPSEILCDGESIIEYECSGPEMASAHSHASYLDAKIACLRPESSEDEVFAFHGVGIGVQCGEEGVYSAGQIYSNCVGDEDDFVNIEEDYHFCYHPIPCSVEEGFCVGELPKAEIRSSEVVESCVMVEPDDEISPESFDNVRHYVAFWGDGVQAEGDCTDLTVTIECSGNGKLELIPHPDVSCTSFSDSTAECTGRPANLDWGAAFQCSGPDFVDSRASVGIPERGDDCSPPPVEGAPGFATQGVVLGVYCTDPIEIDFTGENFECEEGTQHVDSNGVYSCIDIAACPDSTECSVTLAATKMVDVSSCIALPSDFPSMSPSDSPYAVPTN